jgi:hypothetical protein
MAMTSSPDDRALLAQAEEPEGVRAVAANAIAGRQLR